MKQRRGSPAALAAALALVALAPAPAAAARKGRPHGRFPLLPAGQAAAGAGGGGRLRASGANATTAARTSDAASTCQVVSYLRIQKTGSTTFGESILPKMTRNHGQQGRGRYHMEYRGATGIPHACAVTVLRDPVERFMSEFAFARGHEGFLMTQDQWDFADEDLPWLKKVRRIPNDTAALLSYLRSPRNPTRNRQALYLLGFDRVMCDRQCCGLCSYDHPGHPAHAYDWDKDHDELLARAKEHLLSLRAFGVVDCYVDSVRAIAGELGWEPEEAAEMAGKIHRRKQDKRRLLAGLLSTGVSKVSTARHTAMLLNAGSAAGLWRSALDPALRAEIDRLNRVDIELVDFARQHLSERYGVNCSRQAP